MLNKFTILLKKIADYPEQLRDLYLIRKSGLFDDVWYLAKNPDVAVKKINPLFHYLRFGGFEGRDPGPYFCSRWYLDIYDHVKKSGMNPLLHYLKYGREEGLEPQSSTMDFVNSVYCPSCKNRTTEILPHNSGKEKVFCIGQNKTGTTSLGHVLDEFGYKVGIQSVGELLMGDWARRDFRRIIELCRTADAFQDVPFSLDFTYQVLDIAFPNSKFILTVRNNADEWYASLIRFYGKLTGTNRLPTADELKTLTGGGLSWLWRFQQYVYDADESTFVNETTYKTYYMNYNNRVLEYFRYRPKDLLVLNLSDPSATRSLCEFLGIKYTGQKMPHLNKSSDDI